MVGCIPTDVAAADASADCDDDISIVGNSSGNEVRIGSWNCSSLQTYRDLIIKLIEQYDLKIFCILEPRMEEIKLNKYCNFYFKDYTLICSKTAKNENVYAILLIHKSIEIIDIIDFDFSVVANSKKVIANKIHCAGAFIMHNHKKKQLFLFI